MSEDMIREDLDNVLECAARWKADGKGVALATVVTTWGSSPRPVGSQLAVGTLEKYTIKYRLKKIVPYIKQPHREEMCPMEKLSLGKDPEEYYSVMKTMVNRQ